MYFLTFLIKLISYLIHNTNILVFSLFCILPRGTQTQKQAQADEGVTTAVATSQRGQSVAPNFDSKLHLHSSYFTSCIIWQLHLFSSFLQGSVLSFPIPTYMDRCCKTRPSALMRHLVINLSQ
jgi:hypothetical protein